MADAGTHRPGQAKAAAPKRASAGTSSASVAGKGKKRKKKLTRRQKVGRAFLWAGIVILSLILIGIVLIVLYYQRVQLPNPNADFSTATTTLYYRDGTTPLGQLQIQNREPLTSDEIPDDVKNCILAAEDRTFYTNPGVSVPGMVRAGLRVATGGDLQSGSTLTQQYIKVLYLSSEQTMGRKAKEVVLAIKMTNQMPKDQILTDYLNTVYYGRGAYGVQAAAQAYFQVDAKDLSLQQAAVLASLVNNPSAFDPANAANVPALTARYDYVLDGLVAMGKLTPDAESVIKDTLPAFPVITPSNQYGGPQGFLIKMAEQELIDSGMSQAQVDGGGLKIVTTFDKSLQDAMDATETKYLALVPSAAKNPPTDTDPSDPSSQNVLHIGMASVQPGTGAVLALYGGPDYVTSDYNWATQPIAVGSTMKPYVFIAAERQGFTLKTELNGDTFTPTGDTAPLKNAGNANYGRVTLLKATADSINTAYVDLTQQLPGGPASAEQAAVDAGVTSTGQWPAQLNNRLPLGNSDTPISVLDQAAAYATFANNGARATTHVVQQAFDPSGGVIYTGDTSTTQTLEPDIVSDLNYALQQVVQTGSATGAKAIGVPVAGKTGTVENNQGMTPESWFVGYTTGISTAVAYAVGNGSQPLEPFRQAGAGSFSSGAYPVQTWLDYMTTAVRAYPGGDFAKTANVTVTAEPTVETSPTASESPSETVAEQPSQAPETTTRAPAPPADTEPASTTKPVASTSAPKPSSTEPVSPSPAPSSDSPPESTAAAREPEPAAS